MNTNTIWGFPVVEVDGIPGLETANLTITFERDIISSAMRLPYRAPTIEELKVLSRKYRRLMSYRRRYARGKKK